MTVKEYNKTVVLFSDNVYRFILKNIKNVEKAEDIVQDTYEKLWKRHSDVDFEKAKSYLFTSAYRKMIDIIRREKKQGVWSEVAVHQLSHQGHYSDLKEILSQALDRLSENQKYVVMLRDYEGYDYEEIGEITGLSMSQVKVYIFRARKKLKEYLVKMDLVI